jgi:hypothetical protein
MNALTILNFFGAFLSVIFLIFYIESYYSLYKRIFNEENFKNKENTIETYQINE